MLLDKPYAAITNDANAKKVNEERVFKIFTAHPQFRALLGCEFETIQTPRFCGGAASSTGNSPSEGAKRAAPAL